MGQFPALRVTGYVADYKTALDGAAARGRPARSCSSSSARAWATTRPRGGRAARPGRPRHGPGRSPPARDRHGQGPRHARGGLRRRPGRDRPIQPQHPRADQPRARRRLRPRPPSPTRDRYRPELGRVEMHLVARTHQVVHIPGADLTAASPRAKRSTPRPRTSTPARDSASWPIAPASSRKRSGSIVTVVSASSAWRLRSRPA